MKPARKFSKNMLMANTALAWLVLILAVLGSYSEGVVGPLVTLIVGLYGAYTGVGHLDLRAMHGENPETYNSGFADGQLDFHDKLR